MFGILRGHLAMKLRCILKPETSSPSNLPHMALRFSQHWPICFGTAIVGLWLLLLTDRPRAIMPSCGSYLTGGHDASRSIAPVALCYESGLLHVPESELHIRPCRTGLSDLAIRGYPISAALIATSLDIRLVDTGTGLFPYVLDLRPVLLGIEWGANATGYISLSDLAQRLAVRCPVGYRVSCSGGQPEPPPLQNFLRFSPGEVFVVSFEHIPVDFWEDTTFGMPDHRLPDLSGYGPPADSRPSPGRVASTVMPGRPVPLSTRTHGAETLVRLAMPLCVDDSGYGGPFSGRALAAKSRLTLPCSSLLSKLHVPPLRPIEMTCGQPDSPCTPNVVGTCSTPLYSRPQTPTATSLLLPDRLRRHVAQFGPTCLHYTPNVGILLPPAQLPIPVRTQSQSTALRRQSGLGALCWNSRSDEPTLSPFTWPALLLRSSLSISGPMHTHPPLRAAFYGFMTICLWGSISTCQLSTSSLASPSTMSFLIFVQCSGP